MRNLLLLYKVSVDMQNKNQNDDEKEAIINRLMILEQTSKKRDYVFERRKWKIANNTKTINNINNGAIVNETFNNIILVGYGKEDMSILSK